MIAAGSLNLSNIVAAQAGSSGFFDWFLLPLFPLFVIYWVSGVAEPTARRSTWWKANRKSLPATWSSTPAVRSPCSSWPNTRT